MIKILALLIVGYLFTGSFIGLKFVNAQFGASIAYGALTVLLNIVGLAVFWHLIISKKSIALAVFVIIFKYLLLAAILWSLWTIKSIDVVGFCVGLGSLLFGIVLLPIAKMINKKLN